MMLTPRPRLTRSLIASIEPEFGPFAKRSAAADEESIDQPKRFAHAAAEYHPLVRQLTSIDFSRAGPRVQRADEES